jgi:hypothetical protein
MTTSNAAMDVTADKTAAKSGPDKLHEKVAEKRRALGRGLDSLLPGPRVVPAAPMIPQSARKDPPPDATLPSATALSDTAGRAGTPVASSEPFTSGQTADGEPVYQIVLDAIRNNPHQTRVNFDKHYLEELAQSIAVVQSHIV